MMAALLGTWLLVVISIHIIADQGKISSLGSTISYLSTHDELAHFTLIGLLGFFVSMVSVSQFHIGRFAIPKLVVLLMVVVTIEETTQLWRPMRGFSFYDMSANLLGILSFNFIASRLKSRIFDAV